MSLNSGGPTARRSDPVGDVACLPILANTNAKCSHGNTRKEHGRREKIGEEARGPFPFFSVLLTNKVFASCAEFPSSYAA